MAAAKSVKKSTSKTTQKSAAKASTQTTSKTTTKKAAAKAEEAPIQVSHVLGYQLKTWVASARKPKGAEARSGRRGFVVALGRRDAKLLKSSLNGLVTKWQLDMALASEAESIHFQGPQGPVWVLRGPAEVSRDPLAKSGYARFRDLAGPIVAAAQPFKLDKIICDLHGLSADEERGFLVGLEMATYRFTENRDASKARKKLPQLLIKTASEALTPVAIKAAAGLAMSVNIARHLTNLPGGDLTPAIYADTAMELFADSETVKVDVWEGEKLSAERMNLLMAVGRGAQHGPRFVHLRYRPAGITAKPIAIVGKGITFDSGGLDIKPSSGMRLMKKDMGGSAAALALVKWAEAVGLQRPLDVYLALAENSVSGSALRPGDIVTARSGLTIEIHNTDAEGRLVMADAIDVAISAEGDDKPEKLIDIATLTGAIKVGLGAEIAGLFANDGEFSQVIEQAGREAGDLVWPMPLYQPYKSQLRSGFADYSNCSEGGFGGAITAALFLELFVKGVPWAHLDVYAWKDSAGGAWAEGGGSGQPVQLLTNLLAKLAEQG